MANTGGPGDDMQSGDNMQGGDNMQSGGMGGSGASPEARRGTPCTPEQQPLPHLSVKTNT